jgi:hypothetical protein
VKALWIRVEAHAVDSIEVSRLSELLDVDVVTAFGHVCALGGAVAEHAPDGVIATVPDAAIERWGRWTGKRGRFATAVRDVFQTDDGVFGDWLDSMGKLIERRERERVRKANGDADGSPRNGDGNSAETPRSFHGDSGATGRNGTLRDGTEDPALDPSHPESSKRRSGSAPRANSLALGAPDLPEDALVFLGRYYPRGTATERRRRDVYAQVCATLTVGAKVPRSTRVAFAITPERLAAKCREVMQGKVDDPDRAIVLLLIKLADTTSVAAAEIQRETETREREETEGRTRLSRALAWIETKADAQTWLAAELGPEPVPDNAADPLQRVDLVTWRFSRAQLVLRAWRDAGEPAP